MSELIGKKVDVLDKGWVELQDVMGSDLAIINAARTSYLGESKGGDKDKKLLFYLMEHRHDGPFEMATLKYRVHAPELVWRQLLRHRTGCLAGDTLITFNRPRDWKVGHHRSQQGNKGAKLTIERLYRLWNDPVHHSRIKKMLIRVYDETTKIFTVSHIQNVFYSGRKEVFEIETEKGKKLQCTRDHRLLTNNGWQRMEDAIGLEVASTGTATMSKDCIIITNGTEELWRSYEWLKNQRNLGKSVESIALEAGCSYHTIRKWLKIHNLQYTPKERVSLRPVWNKNKKGYKMPPRTEEYLAKLRKSARRGENSHFWRGGITSERAKIGAWTTSVAPLVHKKYNYICQECKHQSNKLHAHHVKPVAEYPELAYDFDNLISVCRNCHRVLHKMQPGNKVPQKPILAGVSEKIKSVIRIGVIDTYDIAVEAPNHNFIANGIVVHNSFNLQSYRYLEAEEEEFYVPDIWRLQAVKNKQGSEGELDAENSAQLTAQLQAQYTAAYQQYQEALGKGVAREIARLFLPGFALYSVGVVQFDLRNLLHFLSLRMASDAQYEIRMFANAMSTYVEQLFPWSWEAYQRFRVKPE